MSVDGEAQRASPSGKSTTPLVSVPACCCFDHQEEQQAAVNAIQSVKSHCEMFLTTLHQLSVEQNQLQEERKALQVVDPFTKLNNYRRHNKDYLVNTNKPTLKCAHNKEPVKRMLRLRLMNLTNN